ncbi:MAG: GNAT family N-acetyltransferase [Bryobacteraceae bacterium]
MSALVDLSNDQFLSAWRLFAQACSGFAEGSARGVPMVFAGVPVPFFNVGLIGSEVPNEKELRQRADAAAEWAGPRNLPWFLVLCHEALPEGLRSGASGILAGGGFQPALTLTGMVADTITPARRPIDGLELRLATDQPLRNALMDINGEAYHMPGGMDADELATESFWSPHWGVVALAGGQPVSCAATFQVKGCRYVGWVATLPDHQRRGYAEAVMRHSLDRAAQRVGPLPSVLHATEAGRPVYERMGYSPIAHYTLYMLAA